jgi:anti-anti-sigma regulatory factor
MAMETIKVLRRYCPHCGAMNSLKVYDRGLKYYIRLMQGNNRVFCKSCRLSWRVRDEKNTMPIKTVQKFLPHYDENEYTIIIMPEKIWHTSIQKFEKTYLHLHANGKKKLVLDLGNINFMDSQTVGEFARWTRRSQMDKIELFMNSCSPKILEQMKPVNGFQMLQFLDQNKIKPVSEDKDTSPIL